MDVNDRFSEAQIGQLTARAVAKIDRQGVHGATLCSIDEIIAMATFIVRLQPLVAPRPRMVIEGVNDDT
tara:strand:+ start:532 stop:738 length:207 start_codon:yes stop_codon:yes gene_type:complete